MIKIKSKKGRITVLLGLIVLFISILFFLLRGPYLSNSIKRIIIPVIENVTRERIIIEKAVINLFPFYLQTKGLKVFDKDGNRLLWITKARAYIDLLGLLTKEIRVRRLTIKEPDLTANEKDLRRIIENVRKSSSIGEKGKYKVDLKNIKLTDGNLKYSDAEEMTSIAGSGLFLDMVSKNTSTTFNVLLHNGKLRLPNHSKLKGGFDGKIIVENKRIEIVKMNAYSSKSVLKANGEILLTPEGKVKDGSLSVEAKIYSAILNKIFRLKQKKDGFFSFDGSVNLFSDKDSKWPDFAVDLRTNSQFYLESLMEILGADENIKGKLSLNGRISGTFPELFGKGTVKLEDAVFDTLPLDDVAGAIEYKEKRFVLSDFTARTYNGKLKGDAYILLPRGDYSVTASVSDVSSPEFFQFIRWKPPFPKGKISGNFQLNHVNGQDIELTADVNYLNTSESEADVISRLKYIEGDIELRGGILRLKDSLLSTSISDLFLDGIVNLNQKTLSLDIELDSRDAIDLTAPYYTKFKAPVKFKGKAEGLIEDPQISGNLEVGSGSIHGLLFTNAYSHLTYRISSLSVDRLKVEQEKSTYDISGSIDFTKSKKLFSFKGPFYKAKFLVKSGDIKPFIAVSYKEIPVSGFVSGILSFEGDANNFTGSGDLIINDSTVFGQELDKTIVKITLHPKDIEFQSVNAYKGESILAAKGKLFFNKKFDISILSNNIRLSDIAVLRDYPIDAFLSLDVKGSGTIDNPDITFSMNVIESKFKGIQVGGGEINGRLKDKELFVKGNFLDGKVNADAKATFSKTIPWTVDVDFKKGKYDFLLSGILGEVPRDLSVSLEGNIRLKAYGNNVSMQSKFDSVDFNLYGYSFKNNKDIVLELIDKKLMIKSFSFTGDNADLSASGVLKFNENYDVTLKGNINIDPLKAVTDKITSLKGQSNFIIDISGHWETPEIIGEINIKDASAILAGFPNKIGPLNGSFFLNKDRITFDSISTDFAGGTVVMSGSGYLKKLTLKRLYISSILNEINIRPIERVNVAFDGKLFYEISSEGSSFTGNIDIRKAKYEKEVVFDNLLLGLKDINKSTMGYTKFLGETALNIRIVGKENIFIDNNIAKAPVNIALNVIGTVARYGLIGRIETGEGNIYFRSNEFKILEGSSVEFVDPNNITPVFHILAETFKTDYYIKLSLDGTLDQFTLSLFSDPPLSEMDILTLLTFGQIKSGVRGFESGLAASEAASVLTGNIQDAVEEKFKHITGFERFDIEPHTTITGAFSPKVTIGKRLIEDKLSVIYSTSIGTTEEHIVNLKYNLNKNVSIVGSRDEIGSTGVDVKYRFEFK